MKMLSQASLQALHRLRTYTPPPTSWPLIPLPRRAAVLILLFPDIHGELKVVLTMRSTMLRSYAGQVALPGGKVDEGDEGAWGTARREAWEEIGLPVGEGEGRGKNGGDGGYGGAIGGKDGGKDGEAGGREKKKGMRGLKGYTVEKLCEMPSHLAKTGVGVRPVVGFLCPEGMSTSFEPSSQFESTSHAISRSKTPSQSTSTPLVTTIQETTTRQPNQSNPSTPIKNIETTLIPRLDPKEVSAIFTAPLAQFLTKKPLPSYSSPTPISATQANDTQPRTPFYTGEWITWNTSRWRMHNFYIPKAASTASSSPSNTNPKTQASGLSSHPNPSDPDLDPYSLVPSPTYRVFGMTARILVDAARIAYGREPDFEYNVHLGDEEMIGGLLKRGEFGDGGGRNRVGVRGSRI